VVINELIQSFGNVTNGVKAMRQSRESNSRQIFCQESPHTQELSLRQEQRSHISRRGRVA